jgi:hypothetical protein
MLPDTYTGTVSGVNELPVVEIRSDRLDLASLPTNPSDSTQIANRPGERIMDLTVDDINQNSVHSNEANTPLNLADAGPALAKLMVSYRENRSVDGFNAGTTNPGFTTIGAVCDILRNAPIPGQFKVDALITLTDPTVDVLRNTLVSTSTNKPFSYLGYLQLVAPVVRLQDWVTVKNHVFTIYATVSTTTQPQIQMRTQVTIDRTRCLYSNELPARISEMEPIGYYNAADD